MSQSHELFLRKCLCKFVFTEPEIKPCCETRLSSHLLTTAVRIAEQSTSFPNLAPSASNSLQPLTQSYWGKSQLLSSCWFPGALPLNKALFAELPTGYSAHFYNFLLSIVIVSIKIGPRNLALVIHLPNRSKLSYQQAGEIQRKTTSRHMTL